MPGSMDPFNQLVGSLQVYLAPVGTTVPSVTSAPSGTWARMGATDGGQKLKLSGKLKFFSDDDHLGNVKAVREESGVMASFRLIGLTLENLAKVLHNASEVATVTGPPATKKTGLKREGTPTEYAMLLRGSALSPYGIYPGQYVIPRGVFDGEPELAHEKAERTGVDVEFVALEDANQSDADMSLGWLEVQTA